MRSTKMQYGVYKFLPSFYIRAQCMISSSSRELWLEDIQDHSRMYVLRQSCLARMGASRGRRYQAYQGCVRTLFDVFICAIHNNNIDPVYSYDAGINAFDTANVGNPTNP